MTGDEARDLLLSIAVTATGRVCLLRDRVLRRIPWNGRMATAAAGVLRVAILSGDRVLDAVVARPVNEAPRASVLLCHGIGETVEHWSRVQLMLAESGVASLVFDYTGYGRSAGFFTAEQAEEDAIAAFHFLEKLTEPLPVSVLGLSLGTGVALAILRRVSAHRLVLLGAFTSLRNAAASVGIPRMLGGAVPPIWDAGAALRACGVPVLIVHGEKDRLFPVRMARDLAEATGPECELVVVPKLGHNEPFYRPQSSYWGEIVARFLANDRDS